MQAPTIAVPTHSGGEKIANLFSGELSTRDIRVTKNYQYKFIERYFIGSYAGLSFTELTDLSPEPLYSFIKRKFASTRCAALDFFSALKMVRSNTW